MQINKSEALQFCDGDHVLWIASGSTRPFPSLVLLRQSKPVYDFSFEEMVLEINKASGCVFFFNQHNISHVNKSIQLYDGKIRHLGRFL